ncbi:hypothetical protein NONI108955_25035 [Nocardia ninae]
MTPARPRPRGTVTDSSMSLLLLGSSECEWSNRGCLIRFDRTRESEWTPACAGSTVRKRLRFSDQAQSGHNQADSSSDTETERDGNRQQHELLLHWQMSVGPTYEMLIPTRNRSRNSKQDRVFLLKALGPTVRICCFFSEQTESGHNQADSSSDTETERDGNRQQHELLLRWDGWVLCSRRDHAKCGVVDAELSRRVGNFASTYLSEPTAYSSFFRAVCPNE